MYPQDVNAKVADLHARLTKERKILDGLQSMKKVTANADVLKSCDAKIKESSKTIGYFEDSLRELQSRGGGVNSGPGGRMGPATPTNANYPYAPQQPPIPLPGSSSGQSINAWPESAGAYRSSHDSGISMTSRDSHAQQPVRHKPVYSNLGACCP